MTWARAPVAKALATAITDALVAADLTAAVFEKPPLTLNPPAIVVGRPSEVRYSTAGFSVDEVTLPVACVHGIDQDDAVSDLLGAVRAAINADPSLGAVVAVAHVSGERAWRNVKIAGTDPLLVADATVLIEM